MFQVNPLLARQRIHLKIQALFSLKDKSKNLKCRLLQVLFGAFRVNTLELANFSQLQKKPDLLMIEDRISSNLLSFRNT